MACNQWLGLLVASLTAWGGIAPARADSAVCTFDTATRTRATRPQGTNGQGPWTWEPPVSLAADPGALLWRASARFGRGKEIGTLAWTRMADPLDSGAAIVALGKSSVSISAVEPDGSLYAMTIATVAARDGRHAAVFVVHTGTVATLSVAQYRGSCSLTQDALATAR